MKPMLVSVTTICLGFLFSLFVLTPNNAVLANGMSDCGEGYIAKDEKSPYEYQTVTDANKATYIYIKTKSENQNDGACTQFLLRKYTDEWQYTKNNCYIVGWLYDEGKYVVTAEKSDGSDCEDIAHVEFYTNQKEVSPTIDPGDPSPTEEPVEPTATPTEDPSTPSSTPTPSTNPTPTLPITNSSSRSSALGYNLNCENNDIEVTYDVKKEDGSAEKDVQVTFTYNDNKQTAKTNENGRARVFFGKNGNGTVKATADGYADQSAYLTMPTCPSPNSQLGRGGQVLGATTGKVLGATSYAATGTMTQSLFTVAQLIGMLLIAVGTAHYVKASIKNSSV